MLRRRFSKLRFKLRLLVAFALAALWMSHAQAVLPTGWTSVRALGMGNAYTAVVSDSDAIFYNPAAMARVSGVHWTIIDPHVGINNPQNAQLAGELGSVGDDVSVFLDKLYGKQIWAGGGGKSAIWVPYFAVAAYSNSEAGVYAGSAPNTRLNMNYFFDYGAALTTAADFIPGFFSMGFTVRYINRSGTTNVVGPSTLALADSNALTSEFKRRGVGYGVDFGALARVPGPISPAVSFVYRDAGVTAFSHNEGAGAPPRTLSEMIVGAGVKVDLFLISVTPSVDFRYVGWTGVATGMNINAGVELGLPFLNIRGGVSQGYYTAGVGLDLGIIRADAATWAVEMGAYPGQDPDRRYMVQATIELGFDPMALFGGFGGKGGSGGSGGAERRGLKRRR